MTTSTVETSAPAATKPHSHDRPFLAGVALSAFAAIGYTATNMCLRDLSTDVDPFWVGCTKAVPTFLVAALLMASRRSRGLSIGLTRSSALFLFVSSLAAQLGANVAMQESFKMIGLAITVPVTTGAMMIASAILGRLMLGELVSHRATASMTVLILAIVALGFGAVEASRSMQTAAALATAPVERSIWEIAIGVLLAVGAGAGYALLGISIRSAAGSGASVSSSLLIVSLTGMCSLSIASWATIGLDGMAATTDRQWQYMIAAGVLNMASFFALSKALQLISIVHVNMVNASQVALAALAGVIWFAEPQSPELWIGVLLTVAGLLLLRRRPRQIAR
jgi:drug/metabolite transporter (DMT)-like permease